MTLIEDKLLPICYLLCMAAGKKLCLSYTGGRAHVSAVDCMGCVAIAIGLGPRRHDHGRRLAAAAFPELMSRGVHSRCPRTDFTNGTRSNTNDAVQAHLGLDEVSSLVFWSRTSARRRLSASAARPKRSAGDTTGASLRGSRGDQPGKVRRGRILGKLARPSLAGSRGRSGMRLMVGTSFCTAHGLGCSDLQPFVSSQPLRTLIA